jgi:hypothetical protein
MKKEIKVVYIGQRFNGDETVSVFIKDGKSDLEENYLRFKTGRFIIGQKYKAEQDGERVQLFTKGVIVGECFENESLLKKWRLESKAASTYKRNQNSKARVDNNPLPEKLIEELKAEVSCLNHKDAVAFLDYLVHEVLFKPMQEEMNKRMNDIINRSRRKKV